MLHSGIRSWPGYEALVDRFDKLLEELERGQLDLDDSPLARVVTWMHHCGTTIREFSSLHPDSIVPPNGGRPMPIEETPPWNPGSRAVPDPFPGEYRFLNVLGKGAFGEVWLAEQVNLGSRLVAIKTLKVPADSTNGPHVLAALKKDAKALARVKHPNVVRVHDLRSSGGQPYLVLDYVEGGSLEGRLKANGGTLDWQDAARYVADVGEALVESHAHGLIHRDIKPANILHDERRDEALLTDFGVSAHLSEPGTTAGTPLYMAPESWDGHVSPALDVFSLAATLFHLATGQLPFPARDTPTRLDQIFRGLSDPDPRCDGLPESLEKTIRAGLAFDAARRPSLGQFVADLRGRLNQILADSLIVPPTVPSTTCVNLRLMVSRQVAEGKYHQITFLPTRRVGLSRNMKRVPPLPELIRLRTGERIRVEVVADREGYVTVFNVGPTGDLNLLYPDEPPTPTPPPLQAGQSLPIVEVEMTPPAGRERLFAVWSRCSLRLEQIATLAGSNREDVSRPYRSTRNMKRIREALEDMPPEDGHAVILELEHLP